MKQVIEVNGEKTLEFDGKIFIIPNSLSRCRDFIGDAAETRRLLSDAIIKATNPEMDQMDDLDLLVQVWIVSEDDLGTENLVSHGCTVCDTDGKEMWFQPCGTSSFEFLPVKLFEGKKEGEIVDLVVPKYKIYKDMGNDKREPVFAKIIMHLQLAQTEYRYRNHGNFEDLLAKAVKIASIPKAANSCEAAAMEV